MKTLQFFHSLYIADLFGKALSFFNIVPVALNTCPFH
jgi:hypothetical protein